MTAKGSDFLPPCAMACGWHEAERKPAVSIARNDNSAGGKGLAVRRAGSFLEIERLDTERNQSHHAGGGTTDAAGRRIALHYG